MSIIFRFFASGLAHLQINVLLLAQYVETYLLVGGICFRALVPRGNFDRDLIGSWLQVLFVDLHPVVKCTFVLPLNPRGASLGKDFDFDGGWLELAHSHTFLLDSMALLRDRDCENLILWNGFADFKRELLLPNSLCSKVKQHHRVEVLVGVGVDANARGREVVYVVTELDKENPVVLRG